MGQFACWRVEAKSYLASHSVFEQKNGSAKTSPYLSTALMMKF
jgi:hypothetical protein